MKPRILLPVIVVLSLTHSAGLCQRARTGFDVLHYDFTLVLPDAGSFIRGRAVITALLTSPSGRIALDLVRLRVDTVLVDGTVAEFRRTDDLIEISPGLRPETRMDTVAVTICYSGEVSDGLIVNTDRQGRWSAFGDNWPNRARNWLPTVDHPSDKATVSWNIIAPRERKVVANGLLVEETTMPPGADVVSPVRSITRWKTDRPIPTSLMVIAAGPLVKFDLGLTASGLSEFPPGVWQSVYVVPELQDYLPGPFAAAGDIVAFFSRSVGPFPYEKLAHLQSRTRFGGMENASAIFYANNAFTQRRVSTGLIAHETAHQWFGDAVTPASWGHLWLSEGFASYFEQLWVEHDAGVAAFRNGMAQLRDEVLRSKVTGSRPVIDTLQTNLIQLLNTNSYQKGAWVLHMLRSMIGDSLFFDGVRSYYKKHRHGIATSDDLCEVFSQTSGVNLRWFFDQWLRRPGAPDLTVKANIQDRERQVIIDVSQNQQLDPFHFPLRIELTDASGRSRLVSVEVPARREVSLAVPFPPEFRPVKLSFDPHIELLASLRVQ